MKKSSVRRRNGGKYYRPQRRAIRGTFGNERSAGSRIVRNPSANIVPLRFRTAMPYIYTWDNTTADPGYYDWILLGNGLWDPDTALGGNSATGLNELANVWANYRVIGSRIKVTVINRDASNVCYAAVIPTQQSSAYAVGQKTGLMLLPRTKSMTVALYDGSKSITNSASTSIIRDVKDIDDVGFAAACNADPAHLWYWHVVTWNSGGGNAANCVIKVEILYDTIFHNPYAFTV